MPDLDSRDVSESSTSLEALFLPSSSVDVSGGSQRFAGTSRKIPDSDIQIIHGNFMPNFPSVLYVAWSAHHINTHWLYLPTFGLYITRGDLLHHELNFAFHAARIRVLEQGIRQSPFIVLMIPHYLYPPRHFQPSLQDLVMEPYLASIADMDVPEVEITTHRLRTWKGMHCKVDKWSVPQTNAFRRLDASWALRQREIAE